MPQPIGQWCEHPSPAPGPPPRPSNPAPAVIARATFPAPMAWAPDTSAVAPQPHPFATVPTVAPSPACPTATPTLICSPTNSTTANSTQRQCGFHLGFGLAQVYRGEAKFINGPVSPVGDLACYCLPSGKGISPLGWRVIPGTGMPPCDVVRWGKRGLRPGSRRAVSPEGTGLCFACGSSHVWEKA